VAGWAAASRAPGWRRKIFSTNQTQPMQEIPSSAKSASTGFPATAVASVVATFSANQLKSWDSNGTLRTGFTGVSLRS
jgi:hypothetical protein